MRGWAWPAKSGRYFCGLPLVGVKTVLNPAPAVRDLDLAKAREASFLMPNETEAAILTSTPVGSEAEVAAATRRLIKRGFEAAVVTLGARLG